MLRQVTLNQPEGVGLEAKKKVSLITSDSNVNSISLDSSRSPYNQK